MRVRPQSYLFPSALLISLFFYATAYSEKKNSDNREGTGRDVKIYNENYKKRVGGSKGDIISYNSVSKNENDYEEQNEREEFKKPDTKKEQKNKKVSEKKNGSTKKDSGESGYYIVKNGDTLFGIAKRSGLSLKKIREINDLNEDSKIYKGMRLRISSGRDDRVSTSDLSEKNPSSTKPLFLWPLKKVKGCTRDGKDGVKSIGIIIKGNAGSEVIAAENGVVKKVGYMRGYGKYIVVKHEKRYITVYSNLRDVNVKAGETVQKGGRIGNISDDMTLHFQIDRAGKPENPLNLLPERG